MGYPFCFPGRKKIYTLSARLAIFFALGQKTEPEMPG